MMELFAPKVAADWDGHYNDDMTRDQINELKRCELLQKNSELILSNQVESCEANYDGLICWSPAKVDRLAISSCLSEIHGIKYDTARKLKIFLKFYLICVYFQSTFILFSFSVR